ncbi:YybH family protein [Pedococcus sp. 2YAF34]|uniref:YybH family protein n=1 Tax=Pedococcus sp. 2YAF34 TaxID=3233032 RepID=UPI003F950695
MNAERAERGPSDREQFLRWVEGTLHAAELALHDGDAEPRRALWSRQEPVSVVGAWRTAIGQAEVGVLFTDLGRSFSGCTSYSFELQAYDAVGDMAYTAGLEHTSTSVDGRPRTYTLRVTQVYRREDGAWRVVHRHGDTVAVEPVATPVSPPELAATTTGGGSA